MFRASQEELQALLITAKKLSRHYSNKYPDIEYQEFYSIALLAIGEALQTYKKQKGKLNTWVSQYIYSRFKNYLQTTRRKLPVSPALSYCEIDFTDKINTSGLTLKEKQAVEYFLKHSEPPANDRNGFYRAVRKLRKRLF